MDSNAEVETHHFNFISAKANSTENTLTLGGGYNGTMAATRIDFVATGGLTNLYSDANRVATVLSNSFDTLKGVSHNIVITASTSYTALQSDHILVFTSGATNAIILTLPAIASVSLGREFRIVNHSGGTIQVSPAWTVGAGYVVSNCVPSQYVTLNNDGTGYRQTSKE